MIGSCSLLPDSVRVALQARHQPVARDPQAAADVRQLGRGRVQHLAALGEDARDGIHKPMRSRAGRRRCGQDAGRAPAAFSRDFFRSRQAISVDLMSSRACGSSTPDRAARSAEGRISCEPPMVRSRVESRNRGLGRLGQPARRFLMIIGRLQARPPGRPRPRNHRYPARRARILSYSRTRRVLASIPAGFNHIQGVSVS